MILPTPPTDNLYKFAAVGGLALILAGLYLPVAWQDREIAVIRGYYDRTRESMRELRTTTDEELKQLIMNSIALDRRLVETTFGSDRRFILVVASGVMVLGFFTAVIGFVRWYCKYQFHQDVKVRIETERLQTRDSPRCDTPLTEIVASAEVDSQ